MREKVQIICVTFKRVMWSLVRGPYGTMQLRDRTKDLIFVAGGSGMAPIKSLVGRIIL